MKTKIRIGIRFKILLLIAPLLICGFTISSTVAVLSTRKNLVLQSSEFMQYKLEQLGNYTASQWSNLEISNYADDREYQQIVKDSIESYARSMIKHESGLILALNRNGEIIFCTLEKDISCSEGDYTLLILSPFMKSNLIEYDFSGISYIGLSKTIKGINWEIVVLQKKSDFVSGIKDLTILQLITFSISFLIIIIGLILILNKITSPINRMIEAIQDIISHQIFTKPVLMEFPDEIGELALNFNTMIDNLEIAHTKIKKYAVDEAVSNKKVFMREIETLDLLGRASDYKDSDTGSHIKRVSGFSLIIGQALKLDESYQELLYYASPLHDIGKLSIPDSILLKNGKLTDKELAIIQQHTVIGYNMLNDFSSKYLKAGAIIAYSHHEKFDGSGYPRGLSGDEIPLFGRIVSIADVFDALTTKRPYKEAWPIQKAIDLIEREKGKHFDPKLVDLFLERIPEIKKIQMDSNIYEQENMGRPYHFKKN